MQKVLVVILTLVLESAPIVGMAQCEADISIYLTDFMFTPNAVTISVGESIAFINAEGTHNVDGTSENNPVSFFLETTEGNIEGLGMGVATFDTPGTYTFNSSVGVQPDLGMVGSITVDAVTLSDQLAEITYGDLELAGLESWQSAFAMNTYFNPSMTGGDFNGVDLNGAESYTLFVPTDAAVSDLMELINLSQFDMLGFYDMVPALQYHIVPGVYLAEDLEDGLTLPTVEGQSVTISLAEQGAMVDDANIIFTNITAFNGVIHIIDKILAPSGYPNATVLDVIMQSEQHTLLEQAIFNEGLDDDLRGQPILNDNEDAPGPFTVFAPTDDALINFAAENEFADVYELLASQYMDNIINQHIVQAVYESSAFYTGMSLQANNNESLNIAASAEGITVNGSMIGQVDLFAYNGVVHSMDELIPFDIPVLEGTCGVWTVNMFSSEPGNGDPWNGSMLDIYVDGVLIASESPNNVGIDSFSFPANTNTVINAVYRGYSGSGSNAFEIEDENGFIIYASSGDGNAGAPKSIYGLRPCGESSSNCGPIKILFTDGAQDGWFGGGMSIYSNEDLVTTIPFYQVYYGFFDYAVMVNVTPGPLDFVVQEPFFEPQFSGYVIFDEQGAILIDETNNNELAPSTYDLEICEGVPSDLYEGVSEFNGLSEASVYPNPSNGVVQLTGISAALNWQASLLKSDGSLVASFRGVGPSPIDFHGVAQGLYSLNVTTSEGRNRLFRIIQN